MSRWALMFLIYIAVRRYRRHIAEDENTLLAMKNEVKQTMKHEKQCTYEVVLSNRKEEKLIFNCNEFSFLND